MESLKGTQIRAELVVSDWCSTDWPLQDWLPEACGWSAGCVGFSLQVVEIRDQYFSVGKGRNRAATAARYDNLFFLDADMLVCKDTLTAGLMSLSKRRANFPVPRYIVSQGNTRNILMPTSKGNCFVTRDMWREAGTWKEWEYWGPEDWAFCDAIEETTTVDRAEPVGFLHQWHPPEWRGRHTREPDHHVSKQWWEANKEKRP